MKELGITVLHPLGWVAKQNLEMGGIVVVDDWTAFTKGDANADAIGILILTMPEATGSARESLEDLRAKLKNVTGQVGSVVVEKREGQEFAWAEYTVRSPSDKSEVYYFLAVITNGTKSVSAFASVYSYRQEDVRPIYRAIVERIKLH